MQEGMRALMLGLKKQLGFRLAIFAAMPVYPIVKGPVTRLFSRLNPPDES